MPDPSSPPRFPVSALYHEDSKLTERRMLAFAERMAGASTEPPPRKVYPSRPTIELARHRRPVFGPRLDDALRSRRSPRGPFRDAPIPAAKLGSLLDLALGVPGDDGLRAWPSAGGLYPLEAYLVALACEGVPRALHHYDPLRHVLAELAPCPPRDELTRLVFTDKLGEPGESRWDHAAAALVFTGVFARTQAKYGERGYRFVHLEAGHAAQNVLLVASALGLSALPLGGFCEDALGAALGLDRAAESPVYVILLGTV